MSTGRIGNNKCQVSTGGVGGTRSVASKIQVSTGGVGVTRSVASKIQVGTGGTGNGARQG